MHVLFNIPLSLFFLSSTQLLVQVHLEMQRTRQQAIQDTFSVIHFVETVPSMLREIPWMQIKESKVSGRRLSKLDNGLSWLVGLSTASGSGWEDV